MKQNIYDDPQFFEGYQKLRDGDTGLNGAVEEPAIRSLLPNLHGLRVLDLGCGFGDFCRFARANGALSVVGVEVVPENWTGRIVKSKPETRSIKCPRNDDSTVLS